MSFVVPMSVNDWNAFCASNLTEDDWNEFFANGYQERIQFRDMIRLRNEYLKKQMDDIDIDEGDGMNEIIFKSLLKKDEWKEFGYQERIQFNEYLKKQMDDDIDEGDEMKDKFVFNSIKIDDKYKICKNEDLNNMMCVATKDK